MIFSVSNDRIERSLDFGPDSGTLTIKNFVQEMTKSFQELPLAAWSLLLSQRQEFSNSHLARVPMTPKQQGLMGMHIDKLSSVGAPNMDTNGYPVFDLEDIELLWADPDLIVDAIFLDAPLSSSTFIVFPMGFRSENSILTDEEQDEENSLPLLTIVVFEGLTPCVDEMSPV